MKEVMSAAEEKCFLTEDQTSEMYGDVDPFLSATRMLLPGEEQAPWETLSALTTKLCGYWQILHIPSRLCLGVLVNPGPKDVHATRVLVCSNP